MSTSTELSGFPPRILQMYWQHSADYMRLMMEEDGDLTTGKDRAAFLITEVQFMLSRFSIFCGYPLLIPYSVFLPNSFFQAVQKIWLANHIRKMAELLHADAVQQLKVTLLGSPASNMVELLSAGLGYLCCMCSFQHCNLDCILTHVRKHLDITIRCPGCGKGFQSAASLHKHGKKAYQIKIVTSSEEQ